MSNPVARGPRLCTGSQYVEPKAGRRILTLGIKVRPVLAVVGTEHVRIWTEADSVDGQCRLADRLADRRLDVALIPSIEVFRGGHRIVSDACIGCRGPVMSVKLFFRTLPSRVATLAVDEGSRTSAALARILLSERHGVAPAIESLPIGAGLADTRADAVLLIGDRAIGDAGSGLSGGSFQMVWDLGDEWCRWTGLPFVFAVWAARDGIDVGGLSHHLSSARDAGRANLAAIAQTNLKRMLAYSTIGQMGFVLLGLLAGVVNGNVLSAENAYSSAMFYMVTYVLTTLGTFGVILLLAREGFESEEIADLAGLNQRSPLYAGVMAVCLFSLAGIPPLVGFYAKLAVLQALVSSGQAAYIGLAVFAVMMSLIATFYYLRVVKVMYFDAPITATTVSAPADVRVVLSFNGALVLVLGIVPGGLMTLCAQAIVKTLSS